MEQTSRPPRMGVPDLGVGVGLRVPHYEHLFERWPSMDFFEVISENFMVEGGLPRRNLDRALSRYRLVQHGVSLSIGSVSPLDREYLTKLKALTRHTKTPWVSDHLCWTGAHGVNLHDLLPLPYTEEAIRHVAARVREVQDFLELPFAIENVSSYMTYTHSAMSEWAFLSAVAEEADCGVLLDVNNIYVSSFNHGFDPMEYVRGAPHRRVMQVHLAGHTNRGKFILDTHDDHVIDPVWDLYREACKLTGPVSTLIEWDAHIPTWDVLAAEAEKARKVREEALATIDRSGSQADARGASTQEVAP
ncbi:MAG: DUF692 domain-containing protein [Polyangiaceae bacterium]